MRLFSLFSLLCVLLLPAQASASLTVCNPSGQMEDGQYIDIVLSTQMGKTASAYPGKEREILRDDSLEAFNDLFLKRGWGDGLPLIPPTPERVEAMLKGFDEPGDIAVAVLPPMDGVATVEKIAVNAVMAGCEPRHMPLLVAAVEAVSQPEFDLRGISTTTNPDAVLVIASGPIVKKMGLNAGSCTFGRGNKGNAAISRALHLIIQNVGGSHPGTTDMSTLGQPGEFVMFLAENGDASPWPPFHTENGFLPERNVVTVASVEGYSGIMGIGYTRPEYLNLIAAWLKGHDRPYRSAIILIIAQDTAKMLAAGKHTSLSQPAGPHSLWRMEATLPRSHGSEASRPRGHSPHERRQRACSHAFCGIHAHHRCRRSWRKEHAHALLGQRTSRQRGSAPSR